MIHLVSAAPGAGKTLFCVELIYNFQKKEPDRKIFTNIDGLEVSKFPNPDNITIFEKPDEVDKDPFDWRDCPDGSIIFYDEAQWFFSASGTKGAQVNPIITQMTEARHKGIDIYFITQAPTFLHPIARKLVGKQFYLYRAFGGKIQSIYEWERLVNNPETKTEQATAIKHYAKLNKKFYSFYHSATIHTHKFKPPRKLILIIFGAILFVSYFVFRYFGHGGLRLLHDKPVEVEQSSLGNDVQNEGRIAHVANDVAQQQTFVWSKKRTAVTPINGCVFVKDKDCACYSKTGDLLDLTVSQCLSIVSNRLPHDIKFGVVSSDNSELPKLD